MAAALESLNDHVDDQLYYYGPVQVQRLFNTLVNLISISAPSDQQAEVAEQLQIYFTPTLEQSPSFYRFLSPLTPIAKPKSKKRTKKNSENDNKAGKSKSKKGNKSSKSKSTSKSPRRRVSTTSEAGESSSDKPDNDFVPSQDFIIEEVLKAVENSKSQLATIMLSKLLNGYAVTCRDAIGQRRLRRLARLDAANHCLRAMRAMLLDPNPSPTMIAAIDSLANALIHVSSKDSKIHLKIRLSGVVSLLAKRVVEADHLYTTPTLLKFICRCGVRSVRNAQAMGREKDFHANLVAVCGKLNHLEIEASNEAKVFASGGISINDCAICSQMVLQIDTDGKTIEFSPPTAAAGTTAKMGRLLEILYLLIKNKKNKTQLIENGILPVLVNIFHNHFERRYDHTLHIEILALVVGCLRQFSRIKKAKDELLVKLDGRAFVETSILTLNAESNVAIERRNRGDPGLEPGVGVTELPDMLLDAAIQLQDSLCALSMRWLPVLPFPMAPRPFSLQFPLPNVSPNQPSSSMSSSVSNKAGGSGVSSLLTRTLRNSLGKAPNKPSKASKTSTPMPAVDSALDDGTQSSDDDGADEEDATLMFIGRRDGDDMDMTLPASEDDFDSDAGASRRRGISGSESSTGPTRRNLRSNDATVGKDPSDVLKYSSQKLSDLASQYQHLFKEYENGALPSNLSPKHRKLNSSKKSIAFRAMVIEASQKTLSVADFVKIPYPDLYEMDMNLEQQLFHSNPDSMRDAMLHRMARCNLENLNFSNVVYDLDDLMNVPPFANDQLPGPLGNEDASRIGRLDPEVNHLKFESRFESGNLRRAIHVANNHYELIISPDINQHSRHFQWFYFEVSNNKANVPYTFEIINCVKKTSMFSNGMQPVLFSVTEAEKGRPGWVRAGTSVCYYRNCYAPRLDSSTDDSDPAVQDKPKDKRKQRKPSESSGAEGKENREIKNFFSTRFTITFRHEADVCYIAYHYPYTYSYLRATLERHLSMTDSHLYVRQDFFTNTLRGNPVPLLTITAPGTDVEVQGREIVIFSARVHPGETNSSWIMHGLLKFLLSDCEEATKLRELCVFKVIPMLNPDGVINGSHRCSLAGQDLNRTWDRPNPNLHPTIYNSKGIVQYCIDVARKTPFAYVDLHGHSRRCNVFMYGNNPEESWRAADHSMGTNNNVYMSLPEIMSQTAPGFSLKECRFNIAKSKEPSARVALWRQFGIERSYTMESTYAGFDIGPYNGKQIGITEHLEMGEKLGAAILTLKNDLENTGSLSYTSPSTSSPAPVTQGSRRRSFTATTASTSMPPAAGTRAAARRNASHHKSATNLSLSK